MQKEIVVLSRALKYTKGLEIDFVYCLSSICSSFRTPKYKEKHTVKVVILAWLNFRDSPVLDELVCFYFHGAEFTPIDLCTKETYWRVFILAFMKSWAKRAKMNVDRKFPLLQLVPNWFCVKCCLVFLLAPYLPTRSLSHILRLFIRLYIRKVFRILNTQWEFDIRHALQRFPVGVEKKLRPYREHVVRDINSEGVKW